MHRPRYTECYVLREQLRLQVLKVYKDGKQIASNLDGGVPAWNLTVPIQAGSRYLLVQEADVGEPYGGYRGQPGLRWAYSALRPPVTQCQRCSRPAVCVSCIESLYGSEAFLVGMCADVVMSCRLKWLSGQPYAGKYDAAPTSTNATQFLRVDGNSLVIDCKK